MPVTQIQKLVNASRPAIYKCTGKALAAGIDAGLKDFYHRPFEPEINEAAKAWAVNSACARPEGHGLAAELRTLNGPENIPGRTHRQPDSPACQKRQRQPFGEFFLPMKYVFPAKKNLKNVFSKESKKSMQAPMCTDGKI